MSHVTSAANTNTASNTLQHTVTHCTTLQHTATHCNTLHHTAPHCNTTYEKVMSQVQRMRTRQATLQHTATHCTTLHHAATQHMNESCHMCSECKQGKQHCNTLHLTAPQHMNESCHICSEYEQGKQQLLSVIERQSHMSHAPSTLDWRVQKGGGRGAGGVEDSLAEEGNCQCKHHCCVQ